MMDRFGHGSARQSAVGAQLLLHARTADLNGRLRNYVGLSLETRLAANYDRPVAMAALNSQILAGLDLGAA